MTINNSLNTDRFQLKFPLWLEDILPVQSAMSYVRSRSSRNSDVDDILNLALERLRKSRCRGVQINKGYVFTTLRNLVIDRNKKLKSERDKRSESEESRLHRPSKEIVSKNSNDDEKSKWVFEAINQFDLRGRVIVKLRCHPLYKFTFKEIGDIIGYSESTARTEFKNIREIIKSYVNAKTYT
ncbi:MAG: sigma-70 family RNA polymerase sigma factor [Planctomycetes bacterium]|nr:sigma-70 family RNA polymerase sigma factor [Planctomycetota bacterium]